MTCATAPSPAAPLVASRRIEGTRAFYLQASMMVTFLAGSSAPTPLYPVYSAAFGFSSLTVTVIFGVYALAVLAALLFGGRLSDHVGRRPVLLAGTAGQVVTMLLFASAHGVGQLVAARVAQGVASGIAVAALGAGMLDIDKGRGALAGAATPPLGTALGALMAGLFVHYLPAPTHLVYAVLAVVFAVQGLAALNMVETAVPRAGGLASLVPQLAMPQPTRRPFVLALPALVATWGFAGFYASLGPKLIGTVAATDASLLGGGALFLLAAAAAAAVIALRHRAPRIVIMVGAVALVAGAATLIVAASTASLATYLAGSAMAGVGFGAGFQGAVRAVMPLAPPRQRAGVLSVIFVVSYLAMGAPAMIAGALVVHTGDILATAREFAVVVITLGLASLLAAWLTPAEVAPLSVRAEKTH